MVVSVKQLVAVIGITGASLGLLAGTAGAEPSGGAEGISGELLTPITNVSLPPLPEVNLPPGARPRWPASTSRRSSRPGS